MVARANFRRSTLRNLISLLPLLASTSFAALWIHSLVENILLALRIINKSENHVVSR